MAGSIFQGSNARHTVLGSCHLARMSAQSDDLTSMRRQKSDAYILPHWPAYRSQVILYYAPPKHPTGQTTRPNGLRRVHATRARERCTSSSLQMQGTLNKNLALSRFLLRSVSAAHCIEPMGHVLERGKLYYHGSSSPRASSTSTVCSSCAMIAPTIISLPR